jgi:hypothetical protein
VSWQAAADLVGELLAVAGQQAEIAGVCGVGALVERLVGVGLPDIAATTVELSTAAT